MASAIYIPGLEVLALPNQPNGFVKIDSNGDVLGTFAQRRDTAANIAGIVLKSGELAFTTDTEEVFVGDGSTAGGLFLFQKWQTSGVLSTPTNTMTLSLSSSATKFTKAVFAGQAYEIEISAVFAGDTSNTSNFALFVHTNPDELDNAYPTMAYFSWNDLSASSLGDVSPVLEAQSAGTNTTSFILAMQPKPLANLTANKMGMIGRLRFKMAYDGTFVAIPMARATSPSIAVCQLTVQHRRIA